MDGQMEVLVELKKIYESTDLKERALKMKEFKQKVEANHE